MYHLFSDDIENQVGLDCYRGKFDTIETALAYVVENNYDWAQLALIVDDNIYKTHELCWDIESKGLVDLGWQWLYPDLPRKLAFKSVEKE